MLFAARTLRRVLVATLALTLAPAAATPLLAAEKPRIRVQDYVIDASVSPMAHKISAHARVKFSALDDISIATFELHNALRVTRVAAEDGTALTAERVSQDSTVRVALPNGLAKGQEMTLIFDYEGIIQNSSDSPVPGLSLAYIGDPASYLLYAGRWFPMSGYGTDRFSAIMRITVPTGYTVIGSGKQGDAGAAQPVSDLPVITAQNEPKLRHQRHGQKEEEPKPAQAPLISGGKTFVFTWDKPSFPGSIFIGKYTDTAISEAGLTIHVYFLQDHAGQAQQYGETAPRSSLFHHALWRATFDRSEAGARFRTILCRPHGRRRSLRFPAAYRRQVELPPAGQHDRPPVVGQWRQSGDAQRLVDRRKAGALRRGAVRRARRRQRRRGRGHQGYVRRRAGLRQCSAGADSARSIRSTRSFSRWPPTRAAWSSTCCAG